MSTPTGASGREHDEQQDAFNEVLARFTLADNRKRDAEDSSESAQPVESSESHYSLSSRNSERSGIDGDELAEPQPGSPVAANEVSASGVRAYTWTGGRTRASTELELQTLISTTLTPTSTTRPTDSGNHTAGSTIGDHYGKPEYRAIMEMCQTPRSVAEIAALNELPIGVARVVLSDMLELGLVATHHVVVDDGSAPHLEMMERVLSGLRRL